MSRHRNRPARPTSTGRPSDGESPARRARAGNRYWVLGILVVLLLSLSGLSREFLSEKEIDQIREAQELDRRTELYLKFAALRLAAFKSRMAGFESKEGDPMEFYSPADMIYGFGQCLRAVEDTIDDALTSKRVEAKPLVKALNLLKDYATQSLPELDKATQLAVNKKDEALYKSVQKAIEITKAAVEGSTEGLRLYEKQVKGKKKK